jgi:hypothetical protein
MPACSKATAVATPPMPPPTIAMPFAGKLTRVFFDVP